MSWIPIQAILSLLMTFNVYYTLGCQYIPRVNAQWFFFFNNSVINLQNHFKALQLTRPQQNFNKTLLKFYKNILTFSKTMATFFSPLLFSSQEQISKAKYWPPQITDIILIPLVRNIPYHSHFSAIIVHLFIYSHMDFGFAWETGLESANHSLLSFCSF